MVNVSLHFSHLLKTLWDSPYVLISVSSITYFIKDLSSLTGLPSIFSFMIVANQRLFLIRYPIHALFSISVYSILISEWRFSWKPKHSLLYLSVEFSSLQRCSTKYCILTFSSFNIVKSLLRIHATLYTKLCISAFLESKLTVSSKNVALFIEH